MVHPNASLDLEIDVLVVGAGVQGLWLLNDLVKAGYSALLIERESIGGEQTLHSQGIIHQGIGYPHCPNVDDFKRAASRWRQFVSGKQELVAHQSASVGFVGLANSLLWEHHWQKSGLSYKLDPIPTKFHGSTLQKLYRTDEFAIDLVRMTRHLMEPVRDLIVRGELTGIHVTDRRVTHVTATLGSQAIRINPESIFLAAGEGNVQLLSRVIGIDDLGATHYLRKSQVVVVRGRPLFDRINLLIPDIWLFVVSQTADDGQPVWLITSDVDKPDDGRHELDADVIQRIIAKLRCFHPALFSHTNLAQMQWGAYVGMKVEPEFNAYGPPPLQRRAENFGLDNLLAIWPTKLTFAPLVSAEVVARIQERAFPQKLRGRSPHYSLPTTSLTLRHEKWRTVNLQEWTDFRNTYSIQD